MSRVSRDNVHFGLIALLSLTLATSFSIWIQNATDAERRERDLLLYGCGWYHALDNGFLPPTTGKLDTRCAAFRRYGSPERPS